MNSQLFQSSGGTDANSPAISEAEFQSLVEMIGADMPDVVVDLLDTYLEESTGLVEQIVGSIVAKDLPTALRPAHSLKSSSASIGAMRLSKLCADLESHLRGSLPGLDPAVQAALIETEFGRVTVALAVEKEKLTPQ